ncbi:CheR family methyltransferase [Thermosulfuriphilus sp.]
MSWLALFSDPESEGLLEDILREILRRVGIDFQQYNRNTLKRRLARRMALASCKDLQEYLAFLKNDPLEAHCLAQEFTIKVSRFFRDKEVFRWLEEVIIPELLKRRQQGALSHIRIWSVGCARGEEPYSLAILVDRLKKTTPSETETTVRIFGSDIDSKALKEAQRGVYGLEALKDVSPEILASYFVPLPGNKPLFKIRTEIKTMVDFIHHDITSSRTTSPPSGVYHEYHLILCRYVLIYCSQGLKGQILKKLHRALAPGGYLILGKAESLCPEIADLFEIVDKEAQIYRKGDGDGR